MLFEEALVKVYKENSKPDLLHPFKVYSFLSDLDYDSYLDNLKVLTYFKLLEHLNLFDYLLNGNLSEVKALRKKENHFDFISDELYKEFVNLTISLKYSKKDFEEVKEAKEEIKVQEKIKIYGYSNGKQKILHHSLSCPALGKDNIYLKFEGKKQTSLPCKYCYQKKLKKEHANLLKMAEINALVYGKSLPLIPLRLKGKKVDSKTVKEYALGRKDLNEI